MPFTTSATRSVPERRTAVNPTIARFDALRYIRSEANLSTGARLLYHALDDHAGPNGGMDGKCFPKQSTLAQQLATPLRTVERWMAELVKNGWVRSIRRLRGNRYELFWAFLNPPLNPPKMADGGTIQKVPPARADGPDPSRPATGVRSRPPNVAVQTAQDPPNAAVLITQTTDYPSIDRSTDGSIEKLTDEPTPEEKLTWMKEVLAEYPGAQRAIGYPPDDRIARKCLDAAQWDTQIAGHIMRETYLRGGRRAAPSQSWGWFPAVFRNYLGQAQAS